MSVTAQFAQKVGVKNIPVDVTITPQPVPGGSVLTITDGLRTEYAETKHGPSQPTDDFVVENIHNILVSFGAEADPAFEPVSQRPAPALPQYG